MIRLCTFALSVLLSNANPLRRQSSLCFSYQCPPMDNALYPLALNLSGPAIGGGYTLTFLECYYPFVSNCQYQLTNGSLVADNDSGSCPGLAPRLCMKVTCSCPRPDTLGIQTENSSILFCTYPTPLQPHVAAYYCNYDSNSGGLIYGTDPSTTSDIFCPGNALSANPPFCFSQSAAPYGTTVTPTGGIPSPSESSIPDVSHPAHPPPSPSGGSLSFHGDDLRLRIVIMGVMLWQLA